MPRSPVATSRACFRSWTPCAIAAGVWLAPRPADAKPPVELAYTAPPGCGSGAEVQRKLDDALARGDVRNVDEETDAVPIAASVSVTGESPRYQLDFEATNGKVTSQRRLVVDSCEAVTEAAAFLLLLAIDPVQARALGAPEDAPEPGDGSEADTATALPSTRPEAEDETPLPVAERSEPDERRPPPSPPASSEDGPFSGSLALGAGLVRGMTPRTALGPALGAGLKFGRLAILGRVGWYRAFTAELPGVDGGSIDAELLRADLRTAVLFGTPRIGFGPALGIGVERMQARSLGVATPGSGATFWPSLSGGVALSAAISEPWGLTAGAGLVLPLARPDFLVRGEAEIAHEPARFGWEASLGISWAFPSQF